jgi:hypothetical protein
MAGVSITAAMRKLQFHAGVLFRTVQAAHAFLNVSAFVYLEF